MAAEGGDAGTKLAGGMGVRIEIANQVDHGRGQVSTRAEAFLEIAIRGVVVIRVGPGDQQVGDFFEAGVPGEALDGPSAVGERAACRVQPHDTSSGGDDPRQARTDIGGHRPLELMGTPVEGS